jgi:hypothetical protein
MNVSKSWGSANFSIVATHSLIRVGSNIGFEKRAHISLHWHAPKAWLMFSAVHRTCRVVTDASIDAMLLDGTEVSNNPEDASDPTFGSRNQSTGSFTQSTQTTSAALARDKLASWTRREKNNLVWKIFVIYDFTAHPHQTVSRLPRVCRALYNKSCIIHSGYVIWNVVQSCLQIFDLLIKIRACLYDVVLENMNLNYDALSKVSTSKTLLENFTKVKTLKKQTIHDHLRFHDLSLFPSPSTLRK